MTRWAAIALAVSVLTLLAWGGLLANGSDRPPATTAVPTTVTETTIVPSTTTAAPAPSTTRAPTTTVAAAPLPAGCFFLDDERDVLITITADGEEALVGRVVDSETGAAPPDNPGAVSQLEAMAMQPGTGRLYVASWGLLGTVDTDTAAFTTVGDTGLADVDGLAFASDGTLYGVSRLVGGVDRLVTIDPATGRATDVGSIRGPGVLEDVDDLAFDPQTGRLYGVANHDGDEERTSVLIAIDPRDARATAVGAHMEAADVEGLGFGADGDLWATTGRRGGGTLYRVDLTTGSGEAVARLSGGFGDFEAVACATAAG